MSWRGAHDPIPSWDPLRKSADAIAALDRLTVQCHLVEDVTLTTLVGFQADRVVWSTTLRTENRPYGYD